MRSRIVSIVIVILVFLITNQSGLLAQDLGLVDGWMFVTSPNEFGLRVDVVHNQSHYWFVTPAESESAILWEGEETLLVLTSLPWGGVLTVYVDSGITVLRLLEFGIVDGSMVVIVNDTYSIQFDRYGFLFSAQ